MRIFLSSDPRRWLAAGVCLLVSSFFFYYCLATYETAETHQMTDKSGHKLYHEDGSPANYTQNTIETNVMLAAEQMTLWFGGLVVAISAIVLYVERKSPSD